MLVSVIVFSVSIGALYYWTKGRATDAPAPGDTAFPPSEATLR